MTDFDDFYAAHYADLTVQVHAYFGDRHEAQDVVQEAFCRALARCGRFPLTTIRPPGPPRRLEPGDQPLAAITHDPCLPQPAAR
jgi:DNA-directed RNA polymerase specialized sigma24 family protein